MRQLTFTREDVANPDRLERLFQQLNRILAEPQAPAGGGPLNLTSLATQLAPLIRSQLQAPGGSPLNLQSLLPGGGLGIVVENTHANRNSLYPAATTDVGVLYWETDRTSGYVNVETAGVRAWTWFGGTYRAALASIPVDLGTSDAGFRFVNTDTDQNTEYVWSGTEWWTVGGYLQEVLDAVTNVATTVQILRHLTTGTAAAGFGGRVVGQLENGSGTTLSAMLDDFELSTVTAGAEVSLWRKWVLLAGALTEALRLEPAIGLTLLLGDLIWKSGTAFTGTLAHANSANRVYTFPDATGTVSLGTTTAAGTWTPTHTNLTNLLTTTPRLTQWAQVGSVVTFAGEFDADPIAPAAATSFEMDLPIASNFANTFEAGGVAFSRNVAGQGAAIFGNVANNTLQVQWTSADLTNQSMNFSGSYLVI